MKQAVGIDPQTALASAVREMKTRARRDSVDVEFSVADAGVPSDEMIELTKPKKP
jgi:hypothetical protein